MSSIGELRQTLTDVGVTLSRCCSRIRPSVRLGGLLAFALLAAGCSIGFHSLVAAKAASPEPSVPRAGYAPDADFIPPEASPRDAVYSHRKLLQTGVTKTGAPVYRFVVCRHLPRNETKLVQVGISKDGRAVLRPTRGDYCEFPETANPPLTVKRVSASASAELRSGTHFANRMVTPPATDFSNGGLTANQQYTCEKFGPACGVALAIQRAENAIGACEIYHYNTSDGTLDWGYFQINSVHLRRAGLNLRDLLDCKTNIDYAYRLYLEKGFEPWTTYTSGAYRKFLRMEQSVPQIARFARAITALSTVARAE